MESSSRMKIRRIRTPQDISATGGKYCDGIAVAYCQTKTSAVLNIAAVYQDAPARTREVNGQNVHP
jgi:hypothetical protein